LALALICALGIASGLIGEQASQTKMDANYPVLKIMQSDGSNDTEKNLLLWGWNQYIEDLNSSSDILGDFIAKNITGKEAMMLSTSLITLNSYTRSELESIKPSEDRKKFHSTALEAINSFESYLFNMGKFFETSEGRYLIIAREDFNKTQELYIESKAESEFIF
jgi:hypothetical protein